MAGAKVLLIVNRRSRLGLSDLSATIEILQKAGMSVIERRFDRPEEIADTIRREAREVELVVIAGGDGTLNAAADVMIECGLPLGILPTGTGNDLARTLGIPVALPEAAGVITAGHRHRIDLGRVNGKHFFNVASIGLSAELIRHHTVERKRRWRVFAYVFSIRDAYRQTRPFRARIECDGKTLQTRAIQISVGNGRHYGGGMTIAEHASIDDGWLDVYCLGPSSFWQLLALLPALRWGRLQRQEAVLVMRGREIEVVTRRPMPVNTDGEITTRTPAKFEVVPQAISVLVPASYGSRPEEEIALDAAQ